MFHSVALNVNNPHFLIMQGRITKVLNMKPPEVLGLLEEAAGALQLQSLPMVGHRAAAGCRGSKGWGLGEGTEARRQDMPSRRKYD